MNNAGGCYNDTVSALLYPLHMADVPAFDPEPQAANIFCTSVTAVSDASTTRSPSAS